MSLSPVDPRLVVPTEPSDSDPTPFFDAFRARFASEFLVAAVGHLGIGELLLEAPLSEEEVGGRLGLEVRPRTVLLTALRALGIVERLDDGRVALSGAARCHLLPGSPLYVGDYFVREAGQPAVVELVHRLRCNRPVGSDADGVGFLYREGLNSAMEAEAGAREFTLTLAGRARNVAPVLAERLPLDGIRTLLDVGGGTGIYSVSLLRRNPGLRAIVWDRPEVLKVAGEFADVSGVADRLERRAGDMFVDPFPGEPDAILLSNILHDWDVPECRRLVARCAEALRPGGRLFIHDVFLDDDLGGPLPAALYSAALFQVTEGRLYSAGEYRAWLAEAGLDSGPVVPTRVNCGVLSAVRPHRA